MKDIDKIIEAIVSGDTFQALRDKFAVKEECHNDFSARFELSLNGLSLHERYFMTAEILHVVENINNESAEILEYKILKTNQRIRVNAELNKHNDCIVKYLYDLYSIKLLSCEDDERRIIYYLLCIYEPVYTISEMLATDRTSLLNSMEDVIKISLDICNTLKKLHSRNIYHNDISIENIYVFPDGSYKPGRIGMDNFSSVNSRILHLNGSHISPEPSLRNDINMVGMTMHMLSENVITKNQFINGKIKRISNKACSKSNGYRNIDDIINDLLKISSKKNKFVIPVAVGAVAIVGAGIFISSAISGDNSSVNQPDDIIAVENEVSDIVSEDIDVVTTRPDANKLSAALMYDDESDDSCVGDINGDGVINQFDADELSDIVNGIGEVPDMEIADINSDGNIDKSDVSCLMSYISYLQESGNDITIDEFVELQNN